MIFRVTKSFEFAYGHRLLNYDGKCRYLHGHNGVVEIDVESSDLDKRGMVIDFNEIRDLIRRWVEDNMDHKMIQITSIVLYPDFLPFRGERKWQRKTKPERCWSATWSPSSCNAARSAPTKPYEFSNTQSTSKSSAIGICLV